VLHKLTVLGIVLVLFSHGVNPRQSNWYAGLAAGRLREPYADAAVPDVLKHFLGGHSPSAA
jgi:hypothetical protein